MRANPLLLYREAYAGLPRAVWTFAAVALVNRAGTMVLPFLSLYLTQHLGYPTVVAGTVLGAFGVGSILGSALGGWAADRHGAARVMGWSLWSGGAAFLVIPLLRSPWAVGAGVLTASMLGDAFRPAAMTAITDHAPPELRTRALALLRLAMNLGMAVGPAAGGFLATRNYGLLFGGDAVTCWLAAALLAWWVRSLAPVPPAQDGAVAAPARSPWRDGPYVAFLAGVALFGLAFFQVMATFPLYLREVYELDEPMIGAMFTLNALLIVALEMPLVRLLERRDGVLVAGVGVATACLGFGILPLGSSLGLVVLSTVIWTTGEMLTIPFTSAVAGGRPGPGSRGRYLGAYSMSFSVAFVLAPPVGTWVYASLGARSLWYGVALTGLALGAGSPLLSRVLRRPAR